MNPLKLLEKAINEHGSGTILKERIGLVNDLLQKAERERSELAQQVEDLQKENEELKGRIASTEPVTGGFSAEAHKVLLYLAQNGDGRSIPQSYIKSGIDMDVNRLKYHLSELETNYYIYGHHFYTSRESEYEIAPKGTKHLMESGAL